MKNREPVVIGIHGLGNKPSKDQLTKWWKLAVIEGMLKYSSRIPLFNFEMAYWADYIYPRPLSLQIQDPTSALFLGEPYLPGNPEIIKPEGYFGNEIVDFLRKKIDEIILSDEFLKSAPSIAEKIIHKFFLEIEIYFSSESIYKVKFAAKEVIRTRLADLLYKNRNKRILLVAHSMGSLIAYDVLSLVAKDVEIDTLITIGSPLGIPYIVSKMKQERVSENGKELKMLTPENIKNGWFNFSDSDDKISTHFKLSDIFLPNSRNVMPADKIVVNNYTNGKQENPHKSYGYLRCSEFSDIAAKFLSEGKSAGRLWAESRISKLFYKTNMLMK